MKNEHNINFEKDKIKSVLNTPEGYFDSLEKDILGKTIGHSQKKKLNPWFMRGAVAASVILFMGLYLVMIKNNKQKISLASVSTLEILEQEELEITQDDFLSLVSIEDLNDLQGEIRENSTNTDNEEIEDFENYEI
jgi:hypothetical protein